MVPTDSHRANVVPICKKKSLRCITGKYRPVSLASVVYKVFEQGTLPKCNYDKPAWTYERLFLSDHSIIIL